MARNNTRSSNASTKHSNAGGVEETKTSEPPRDSHAANGAPVLHLLPAETGAGPSAASATAGAGGESSPPSTPQQSTAITVRNPKTGRDIQLVRNTPDSQQVSPERELDYPCPRELCKVALFLKENSNPAKQDYPACRRFPKCAWTGLHVKFGDKPCYFCAQVLLVGECVWAYPIPNSGSSPEWANWCLNIGDCLLDTDDDGVHKNVRLAGDDDVGKRCKACKRDDPTILETDQLVAKSANPFHIGCAVKLRKEWEAKINATSDQRCATSNAKKAAKATFEKETKKPRQALAKGTKLDFN